MNSSNSLPGIQTNTEGNQTNPQKLQVFEDLALQVNHGYCEEQ